MQKIAGDIIILHMCIKNHDHMMEVPETWSETNIIFCHFGPFFPLLPPNKPKNKNLEKMKKSGDSILLHMCTINQDHMVYGS